MNSIFYDVLKLKTASKYKKYFDYHFYEACFETLRLFMNHPKTPNEVV